jgi:hypothetical protein
MEVTNWLATSSDKDATNYSYLKQCIVISHRQEQHYHWSEILHPSWSVIIGFLIGKCEAQNFSNITMLARQTRKKFLFCGNGRKLIGRACFRGPSIWCDVIFLMFPHERRTNEDLLGTALRTQRRSLSARSSQKDPGRGASHRYLYTHVLVQVSILVLYLYKYIVPG